MREKHIRAALEQARKSVHLHNRLISFLTLLLLPLALYIWVSRADPKVIGWEPFWTVVIVIVMIQGFTFLFLDRKASEDTPQLVFAYSELERDLAEAVELADELSESLMSTVTAQMIGRVWSAKQAVLGTLFKAGKIAVKPACEAIISPLIGQADKLFGWGYDDVWSVSVYQWYPADRLLMPVWWSRSPSHPSGSASPRNWQDGEGHCGTAFMSQQTLFTTDMAEENNLNRVRPSPGNVRAYDRDTYRSFATVPLTINLPSGDCRLGVAAITSDKVGRFGDSNVTIIEQLGDVLAQVLWLDILDKGLAEEYEKRVALEGYDEQASPDQAVGARDQGQVPVEGGGSASP